MSESSILGRRMRHYGNLPHTSPPRPYRFLRLRYSWTRLAIGIAGFMIAVRII